MNVSRFAALFVSISILSQNSLAAQRCQEMFSPIELVRNLTFENKHINILTQIEKVRKGENIAGIVFNDRQSSIENQGGLGVCHLYSFASQFSNHLKKNHDITEEFEIAPQYWTFHHYLKRTKELLKNETAESLENGLGSHFGASAELIRDIGAMTKQAWRNIGGKENNLSGNELKLVKAQLEKIVIESKSTERVIKQLLQQIEIDPTLSRAEKQKMLKNKMSRATEIQQSTLVEQTLSRLKNENSLLFQDKQVWDLLIKASKGVSLTGEITIEQFKKIDVLLSKNSANKIENLLMQFFFKNPETVSFENMNIYIGNKTYISPKEFAQNELQLLDSPTVALWPSRDLTKQSNNKKTLMPNFPKKIADLGLMMSHETFDQEVMNKIDNGENVWIGYEHNNLAVDKNGIIAMEYRTMRPFTAIKTRAERDVFEFSEGGHAVQIVGYVKNPVNNELVMWIIKNSWGEDVGNNGYFYMYKSYAHNYMNYGATFDSSEQAKQAYAALNKKPKVKLPKDKKDP